ncbi:cation-translocating P-type ATPase [Rugamonas sp. DEMB1]|uniref:cation-translocating P-type ATPase n=1 Tax=Rugamonas sp. DEMB1 TaxID=3039386 RepID=UPI0024487EC5|nr:HAD-IC family P-type ATPase [Rugamonas sp. DEMB1]WGG52580.1 HAD-IC family P-type ATPase [Rugamonas sp. DEMB1]
MPPDAADQQGLSQAEAARRLLADGPNELPQSRPRSALRQLRGVLAEPMFLLLVACGGIYMVLGDRAEALMLLGFVFIVIAISFVQQRRSERSLDALRDLSSPRALVLRDGVAQRIAGRELVEGDIVLLAEGDRVPADMALLDASNLTIDESMLTGESLPVAKQLPLADDDNTATATLAASAAVYAYAGTLVTQGMGRGRVSATGERSALGQIGKSLAALGGEQTPTQLQTAEIVRRVAAIGLAVATALALAWWALLGDWLNGLLAGLTLAMAILPEELPVVLTLFLGLGAWRLSREKVLARSVPAIELLGATTVLCVDKTGTLTANRMAVRRLWSEQAAYDCAADAATTAATQGADPASAGAAAGGHAGRNPAPLQEELHGVLEYAVLASHRRAYDPMESAIGDAGQRLLANTEHLHADWTLVNDYPLSREMLAMSRVWQSPDRRELMIAAKGAPEAVVDLCHMDAARAAAIAAQVEALARDGLRVLGVACATFSASELPGNQHDFDFDFLGLVALEDPIRPDVPAAIAECRAAGIRVVMITGDHPATALSIARQAGLPVDGAAMTGAELAGLDDATLRARLPNTQVFCRVQPEQKLRLVQAFRAAGEVVAMTGDGVNDAPALKAAHIGVAMGAHGTDVAREAAALVLLTDDFSSLVTAVRYGRRVFANLRKAIVFVVAVHVPIVGLSLLPLLFGWPMLLMPVHILFLQLIIDPACSVVFEAEEIEAGAMAAPPRPPEARLFDRAVLERGLWQGGGLLATLVGVYALARWHSGSDQVARALAFSVLVLSNLGLIQANRVWGRGAGWGRGGQAGRYFGAIALATCALLAAALGLPALGQLFGFVRPDAALLLAGAAVVGLNLLWFEAVKRVLTRAERAS